MADSRIFRIKADITIEKIGREVENFLRNEKELTVEGFASFDGYLVQARESSTWKKFAGLGQALQVQIIPSGDSEVLVNIGQGKWADKAGAAAVGLLVFAPLALTSAFGAYKQNKLPSEIFECIERFIVSGGNSVRRNVSFDRLDSSQMKCPSCGAVNPKGTRFCASCGNKLTNTCSNCGNEVVLGVKFCPNCGNSMDSALKEKCPNCGQAVNSGERFCPNCGAAIGEKKICSSCGAELNPNQRFCGKCGTPVDR